MSPFAIFLLSISMSADAFAAAVGKGAAHRPGFGAALRGGLVFGVVEAITPIIGWALGKVAAGLIESIDHWIAFFLLAAVGIKLIHEGLTRDDDEEDETAGSDGIFGKGLIPFVAVAIGTSIDAAAVGVSLALLDVNIWIVAAAIGFSTFVLTTFGMVIGRRAGHLLGPSAEVVGGLILIGIGTSILLEHLGIMAGFTLPG